MHLKLSSAKWRPFCPGGDELFVLLSSTQIYTAVTIQTMTSKLFAWKKIYIYVLTWWQYWDNSYWILFCGFIDGKLIGPWEKWKPLIFKYTMLWLQPQNEDAAFMTIHNRFEKPLCRATMKFYEDIIIIVKLLYDELFWEMSNKIHIYISYYFFSKMEQYHFFKVALMENKNMHVKLTKPISCLLMAW